MRYTVITAQVAAVALTGGAIGLWLSPGRGIDTTPPQPTHVQPTTPQPCVAEDGPGPCFWDAHVRGNHEGTSFWVTADGKIVHEPYGGCDEAWQAPKSEAAVWCRDHGLSR